MSFLKWFSGRNSFSDASVFSSCSDKVCIVDATGLVNQRNRSENWQGSPRDNAAVLKDLAQFASREDLEVKAVFTGRELREASEGGKHSGVFAHYADTRKEVRRKIGLLAKRAPRGKVVVLTSDPEVEREALILKADCMRLSTLKKAMGNREDRQRPQRRWHEEAREPAGDKGSETEKAAATQDVRSTAVYNLIDPV